MGKQPLANSYHTGETLPVYPLEVVLCESCFHSQLSIVVNPDAMFKNYLYVSGTTDTFRNHCRDLAKDAVRRFDKKHLNALDVACNDGTQLEYFRKLGCEVMGIDPAVNLRPLTKKKKLPVLVEYWVPEVAEKMKKEFDIITATNVFAHVNDLDEFLNASKIALSNDGLLILEFPYANQMITHNEFDTVYHEHLSYFLVNSFATLISRMEMHIVDVLQTKIHGGSIRFFVKNGRKRQNKKIERLIMKEKKQGLLKKQTYVLFAKRVAQNKKDCVKLIRTLRKKGNTIIGYGASAKGNTMLNYFKIKLDYTIDDNPLKCGLMTPGMNIPIKPAKTLKKEKNTLEIVITAWNFYNEIVKRIIAERGSQGKDWTILYVPTVSRKLIKKEETLNVSA